MPAAPLPASIDEATFYRAPRPPAEEGALTLAARRPLRFGAVLLGLGVAGILVQRGFVRQLVVGAPVFEEMAKAGLALVVVAALALRAPWARLVPAWATGAAFGWFEHASTYPDEALGDLLLRAAFHAGTTGLSLAAFSMLEPDEDVRLRWGSTLPSTLLHWANNFGVLVLALAGLVFSAAEAAALALSSFVTAASYVTTFALLGARERVRRAVAARAARILPARPEPPAPAAPPPPETPPPP